MRFVFLVFAGALASSFAVASEPAVNRSTADLEASTLTEGDVSMCMLNFKAFANNPTTDGQMVVDTKLGFILDEGDKQIMHYLRIVAMNVKSVDPVKLEPVMPTAAYVEGRSGASTNADRRAQLPEDNALSTFFAGEDNALVVNVDMFKNKEVTLVFTRPNGREVKVPVALTTPKVVENKVFPDAQELIDFGTCHAGLMERLTALRARN